MSAQPGAGRHVPDGGPRAESRTPRATPARGPVRAAAGRQPARSRRPVRWHIAGFLAPAVLLYTAFIVFPLVASMRLSLYSATASGGDGFVGLANFNRLFTDPRWSVLFWRALGHTGEFFAIHVVAQNVIAIILAVLLTHRALRARALLRALVFSPTIISVVLVGFVWKLILSPLWGVTPTVLSPFGLKGLYEPWLGQESSALITITLISVWQYTGIPMLLFIAALLGIDESVVESARVDGASAWRVFRHIQLPLIMPTVGIAVVLTFVGSSKAFDLVYAVSGSNAGPSYSTDLLGTFFYRTFAGYFTQQPDPYMAATIATVTVVIVGAVICGYLFIVQRRLQRA